MTVIVHNIIDILAAVVILGVAFGPLVALIVSLPRAIIHDRRHQRLEIRRKDAVRRGDQDLSLSLARQQTALTRKGRAWLKSLDLSQS